MQNSMPTLMLNNLQRVELDGKPQPCDTALSCHIGAVTHTQLRFTTLPSDAIKIIANYAIDITARGRFFLKTGAALAVVALTMACAGLNTSVGVSVPMGRAGGVGVSVGSGGAVSGSVGVGVGGGSVSVGASGQLPKPAEKKTAPEAEKKEEKKL
jgi:hypothetical protein